jgi:hypothetical protein
MAYRHYTRCVAPAEFNSFSRIARILAVGFFAALVTSLIAVFADHPVGIISRSGYLPR